MKEESKGYFSLIQYCPMPSRREVANVGVVLVCADRQFQEVLIARNHDRVRRFFGIRGQDLKNLQKLEGSLSFRIENANLRTVDALAEFARLRSNELVMTTPSFIAVDDPSMTLLALFREMVAPPTTVRHRSDLRTQLGRLFKRYVSVQMASKDIQINVPVLDRPWDADFSYETQRMNYVRVQSIADKRSETEAIRVITEWDLLQRHHVTATGSELIVPLPTPVTQEQEVVRTKLRQLFGEYNVETVIEEEFSRYATKVQHELGAPA